MKIQAASLPAKTGWFATLLMLLLLAGCAPPQTLEFRGMAGAKLVRDKANHQLELHMGVKLFNPNKYKILLKKTRLGVYVNNIRIGDARGRFAKQKVDGKKEGTFELVVTLDRDQFVKAAVGSIAKILLGKSSIKLKVDGFVKGGVLMLGKKFPINLEKEIDLDLKDLL